MTATEALAETSQPVSPAPVKSWKNALLFGTGLGIVIGPRNLEVVLVRTRPAGPTLAGETSIADFRTRPAAEWGAELLRFVSAHGESRLAATVLLPRDEVIVRTLALPGVPDRDVPGAIGLQIETLHPWGGGEDEVAWGWSRADASSVMVGLARKTTTDGWETLFTEAGIPLAALTFSPAVVFSALRMWSPAPRPLLCFTAGTPRIEIYGESDGRAVYSAEFSTSLERALSVARAELRLAPDVLAQPLNNVLPQPGAASILGWAAGLAGSTPRAAGFANLLAPERRASHDRMQYVLPVTFGALLAIALILAYAVFPAIEERRYREDLNQAVNSLEPAALRVQNLDKRIAADRAKTGAFDDFRRRAQSDLDILNELTRLLPPPVWTSAIEIYPDSVVISGEADQAAPLLKIIDASPLFQNSEFGASVTRNKEGEQFRIRTIRRGRAGRLTP